MDEIFEKFLYWTIYAVYWVIGFLLRLFLWDLPKYLYYYIKYKIPRGFLYPHAQRFEHTHIVAGSGHGKTQLIQHIFLNQDLHQIASGNASVVIIDSQGDLINKILRLRALSPARAEPEVAIPPAKQQPETSAAAAEQPKQSSSAPSELPKPRRTVLLQVWHACLVFLLLFVLTIVGVIVAQIATDYKNMTAYAAIFPIGLLFGIWLGRWKTPPSRIAWSIGTLCFLAFAIAVSHKQTAVIVVLWMVCSMLLGYFLMRRFGRMTKDRATDPSKRSRQESRKPEKPQARVADVKPAKPRPSLADRLVPTGRILPYMCATTRRNLSA